MSAEEDLRHQLEDIDPNYTISSLGRIWYVRMTVAGQRCDVNEVGRLQAMDAALRKAKKLLQKEGD